jgi:hypothetical protein
MFERQPPSAGEVRALAHQLLSWADHLRTQSGAEREITEQDRRDMQLALAEAMRSSRRQRARIFAGGPPGSVLWDLLLELFIRDLNGFRTPIDQQLVIGDLPFETLERSLKTLSSLGLVVLTVDRLDPSKMWISLSQRGHQNMFDYLQEFAELLGLHPQSKARAELESD